MRNPSLIPAIVLVASTSTQLVTYRQTQPVQLQVAPAPQPIRELTIFDRQGRIAGTVGEPGVYAQPALSPDGTRIAAIRAGDVWVFDVARRSGAQITATPDPEGSPLWSRDGSQIVYRRTGTSQGFVYRKASNGTGPEEQIGQLPGPLTDWSKDGRFILGSYDASQTPTKGDVFLLPLAGPIRLVALLATSATENGGHFSFDGRLVAYGSDGEVFVRPFNAPAEGVPTVGDATKVSNTDRTLLSPRWRNDGRELYYLSADGYMTAVPITTQPFRAGTPTKLFQVPANFLKGTPGPTASTDVSGDGQRFVLLLPAN
jgi:Tol biopolymer transport system component